MSTNIFNSTFNKSFQIGKINIDEDSPVCIIAEAGVSHFCDIGKMYELIDLAVESGADIFKTQAYKTEEMISPFFEEWYGRMKIKEVNIDFLEKAKEHCENKRIEFLCTPHDKKVLEWLEYLNVSAYKIGSGENYNYNFIRDVCSTGKPVIISTGMHTYDNILDTLNVVKSLGNKNIAILHCVTSYPVIDSQVNLLSIRYLKDKLNIPIGYSDHTDSHIAAIGAIFLGARIIEKHITLEFNVPNAQDWKVSCGPKDFSIFIKNIRKAELQLGQYDKQVMSCEINSKKWAIKKIVASKVIKSGTILDETLFSFKRAQEGFTPDQISQIAGKRVNKNIKKDQPITKKDLD